MAKLIVWILALPPFLTVVAIIIPTEASFLRSIGIAEFSLKALGYISRSITADLKLIPEFGSAILSGAVLSKVPEADLPKLKRLVAWFAIGYIFYVFMAFYSTELRSGLVDSIGADLGQSALTFFSTLRFWCLVTCAGMLGFAIKKQSG